MRFCSKITKILDTFFLFLLNHIAEHIFSNHCALCAALAAYFLRTGLRKKEGILTQRLYILKA